MIVSQDSKKKFLAISYETVTYTDLSYYLSQENQVLERIEPDTFLESGCGDEYQVVNLVMLDLNKRKQVSQAIDQYNIPRFSYIHPSAVIMSDQVALGTIVHPFVAIMRGVKSGPDVMYFGHNAVGHNAQIGRGSLLNSYVQISGSTKVGDFCLIHSGALVYDNIAICSDVTLAAKSVVRKSITTSGIYGTVNAGKFQRIGNR